MSNADALLHALEQAQAGGEPARTIEEALANASIEVRNRAAEVAADKLSPERLVELVTRGESYMRRATAMEALRQAGEKALDAVETGALSSTHDTALFCIQVLAGIDHPRARARLRQLVGHPDLLLSQAAVESLGEQRDSESVSLLLELLSDDREALEMDPWRALSAVIALGQIGSAEAIDGLLRLRGSDIFRDTVDEALSAIRGASGAFA